MIIIMSFSYSIVFVLLHIPIYGADARTEDYRVTLFCRLLQQQHALAEIAVSVHYLKVLALQYTPANGCISATQTIPGKQGILQIRAAWLLRAAWPI